MRLKQPKKLSREQKQHVAKYLLYPADWMLVEDKIDHFIIIHKQTKEIREIERT